MTVLGEAKLLFYIFWREGGGKERPISLIAGKKGKRGRKKPPPFPLFPKKKLVQCLSQAGRRRKKKKAERERGIRQSSISLWQKGRISRRIPLWGPKENPARQSTIPIKLARKLWGGRGKEDFPHITFSRKERWSKTFIIFICTQAERKERGRKLMPLFESREKKLQGAWNYSPSSFLKRKKRGKGGVPREKGKLPS